MVGVGSAVFGNYSCKRKLKKSQSAHSGILIKYYVTLLCLRQTQNNTTKIEVYPITAQNAGEAQEKKSYCSD